MTENATTGSAGDWGLGIGDGDGWGDKGAAKVRVRDRKSVV